MQIYIFILSLLFYFLSPFALFCPFLTRRELRAPVPSPLPSQTYSATQPLDPPIRRKLPREIIRAVFHTYIYVNIILPLDTRGSRYISTLPRDFAPLALSSRLFYELVCNEWNALFVRRIVYIENYLPLVRVACVVMGRATPPLDVSRLRNLECVTFDLSNAFDYQSRVWRPSPFARKLPKSLKKIELWHSYMQEHELIDRVGRLCPQVVELRIVLCTMFNDPECVWWSGHQDGTDHHYMKGHDPQTVFNYAVALSENLRPLNYLRRLHLGVYFAPIQMVTCHRSDPRHARHPTQRDSTAYVDGTTYHNAVHFQAEWRDLHPGFPIPNLNRPRLMGRCHWEVECRECIKEFRDPIIAAERLAASTLAARIWSLDVVSFASFVAANRIRPSEWEVTRWIESASGDRVPVNDKFVRADVYPEGTQLHVYTKRTGAPCASRVGRVFWWTNNGWTTTP